MNLLLALTAKAAPPAFIFGPMRPRPYEDLFWGLIGLGLAVVIARFIIRIRRQLPGVDSTNAIAQPLDAETILARKLAQWHSSILILVTASALGMLVKWFDLLNGYGVKSLSDLAGPMSESLTFYPFAFVPVLVWHLADLIERPHARPNLLASLVSHALLCGVLVTSGIAWVLDATGLFTVERPCSGSFVLLFESCRGPMPALGLPMHLFLLGLIPISLVKLAVAMWSRLGPRP